MFHARNLGLYVLFTLFGKLFSQGLEVPSLLPAENPITHTAYTTSYAHEHGQPYWVAYDLTYKQLTAVAERPGRFRPDPRIQPRTTSHEAYTKTGFDRGHLAPAADMAWSTTTMSESFYTSNICPQRPGFNRGIWKILETKVRNWASQSTAAGSMPHLFIVTGPIFTANMTNLNRGSSKNLHVPEYFFKALIDTAGNKRGIAFIIPNQKIPSETLWNYALSIDELELKLGRDLFPKLPNEIENKIEAVWNKRDWN